MPSVQVRYIVKDVDAAIAFYCRLLGFQVVMHPAPAFAMLSRGDLRLVLSAPNPQPEAGRRCRTEHGRNPVAGIDLRLRWTISRRWWKRYARLMCASEMRIVTGVGGKQIILDDPSGNPVELFEPILSEARLDRKS